MTRARLTIVDVVTAAASVAVLGILAKPMMTALRNNSGDLGQMEAFLFLAIPPALVMSLFVLIFATAIGGRPS